MAILLQENFMVARVLQIFTINVIKQLEGKEGKMNKAYLDRLLKAAAKNLGLLIKVTTCDNNGCVVSVQKTISLRKEGTGLKQIIVWMEVIVPDSLFGRNSFEKDVSILLNRIRSVSASEGKDELLKLAGGGFLEKDAGEIGSVKQ